MKITHLLALGASLLMIGAAEAVVVTADSGGFTQGVTNAAGTALPLGSGYVSVGYFTSFGAGTNFSTLTGAQIDTNFVSFGNSFAIGGTDFGGFYVGSVDGGRVGASSDFLGKTLVTIVGNASTLAASTQVLIYQHSVTFPNDDGAPAPAALTAVLGSPGGAYLFGGPSGSVTIAGVQLPAVRLAQIAAIPEPSAVLLGAVGALGLLRRRR